MKTNLLLILLFVCVLLNACNEKKSGKNSNSSDDTSMRDMSATAPMRDSVITDSNSADTGGTTLPKKPEQP